MELCKYCGFVRHTHKDDTSYGTTPITRWSSGALAISRMCSGYFGNARMNSASHKENATEIPPARLDLYLSSQCFLLPAQGILSTSQV
ncbi:hypothetical protein J6590_100451 [Homalodisca vitripennis]|nr:hypothetical protein J6590_100451 [Homalodisca vitripennis]